MLICLFSCRFLDKSNAVRWKSWIWKSCLLWIYFFGNGCHSNSQGETYSRGRWSLEDFLDAHRSMLKSGEILFSQQTFCVEIFCRFSTTGPQPLDGSYQVFPACTLAVSPWSTTQFSMLDPEALCGDAVIWVHSPLESIKSSRNT